MSHFRHYEAPHQVTNKTKLAAMIEQIRNGQHLPPVAVYGDRAFTGSHRIAAYREAHYAFERQYEGWEVERFADDFEVALPVVEISEEVYLAACEAHGIEPGDEPGGEWNLWASRLYASAEQFGETELMTVLVDQRHEYEYEYEYE